MRRLKLVPLFGILMVTSAVGASAGPKQIVEKLLNDKVQENVNEGKAAWEQGKKAIQTERKSLEAGGVQKILAKPSGGLKTRTLNLRQMQRQNPKHKKYPWLRPAR